MRLRALLLAGAYTAIFGTPGAAQIDRAGLIEQARLTPDDAARRGLFMAAANPVEPDSLWAVSVYEIAQIMRDLGEDDVAASWIRWAARQGGWPIDRAYFAPSLVAFYDSVAADVTPDPDGATDVVETVWSWPAGFQDGSDGALTVGAGGSGAVLTVTVDGRSTLGAGETLSLPPGSYDLTAGAAGFETITVQREVLPGIETRAAFDLVPILPPEVLDRVSPTVVRLRIDAGPTCRNGVSVGDQWVVTALGALGAATSVDVLRADGSAVTARVADVDPARGLAVLAADEPLGSDAPTPPSGTPSYGWALFHEGCADGLRTARARLDDGAALTGIPGDALGSALVDRSGGLVGLVGEDGSLSPMGAVNDAVAAATAQVEQGRFPTLWVVAGAAVVGGAVAALFLMGDDSVTPPNTGSISIPIPIG